MADTVSKGRVSILTRANLTQVLLNTTMCFFDVQLTHAHSMIMTLGPPYSLGNLEATQQAETNLLEQKSGVEVG